MDRPGAALQRAGPARGLTLYFAYGSNLWTARMQERVPTARALGPACLPGHRLVCSKPGRDGSGKANLEPTPEQAVWGVLYRIDAEGLSQLDRFEGGYERIILEVVDMHGILRRASTYRSSLRSAEPVLFDWYRQLMIDGARLHGLPRSWLAFLETLPMRPDPARAANAPASLPARRPR